MLTTLALGTTIVLPGGTTGPALMLLIGTNDLCAEMGLHGDFGDERVADAYRAMIAAARKHGKFPGMAGIYNETIMPRYIRRRALAFPPWVIW
jgi:citrate lyase beta subunit